MRRLLASTFITNLVIFSLSPLVWAHEGFVGRMFVCKATSSMKMSDRILTGKSITIPKTYVQEEMKPEFTFIDLSNTSINDGDYKNPFLMFGSYDLKHQNKPKDIFDLMTPRFAMPRGEQAGNKMNFDLNVLRPEPRSASSPLSPVQPVKVKSDDLVFRRNGPGIAYYGLSISGISGKADDIEKFMDGTGNKTFGEIFGMGENYTGGWEAALVVPKSFALKGSSQEKFPARLVFRFAHPKAWNATLENRVELMCSHQQYLDSDMLEAVVTASTSVDSTGELGIPEVEGILNGEEGERNKLHFSSNKQSSFDSTANVLENYPLFGLTSMPALEMARVLNDPELRVHAIQITAATVGASLLISAYRFLGIGGRQKALAAIVPPGVLNDWLGRVGYRVPPHEDFLLEDVRHLSERIGTFGDEDEAREFLETQDPELVAYFYAVVDYIRYARAMENSVHCPDQNQCT